MRQASSASGLKVQPPCRRENGPSFRRSRMLVGRWWTFSVEKVWRMPRKSMVMAADMPSSVRDSSCVPPHQGRKPG